MSPRACLGLTVLLWASVARPTAARFLMDIGTDRACYGPGASVLVTVNLTNRTGQSALRGSVTLAFHHLDRDVSRPQAQPFRLAPGGDASLTFRWKPPGGNGQGYLVDAVAKDDAGRALDRRSTAVDVSSSWTKFPRYGYLSRFPPQSAAVSRHIVRQLNRYHLNALQFQDWQFKHHRPLAGTVAQPAPLWQDVANRPTARQTVLDFLTIAHQTGMAALNYNLLYGAWAGYSDDGVDYHWGLWKKPDGTNQDALPMPGGWATPTIYLFNPGDPGWQNYLLNRETDVFAAYPFDGWQVDQVGDRGPVYTHDGKPIALAETFAPFLAAARARLGKTLVFNCVGGYGLDETAARAPTDVLYIECWEWSGQATYQDLHRLIARAQALSGGKPVILAAYLNRDYANKFSPDHPGRFNVPGVLLADAVIFASGGTHIEVGDDMRLLDSEYFPNRNLTMSQDLRDRLRDYYDFQVAYENLLCGGLSEALGPVTLEGAPSSVDGTPGTVWTFARSSPDYEVVHLINLVGEKSDLWRDANADAPSPMPQQDLVVRYHGSSEPGTRAFLASPDRDGGRPTPLAFSRGADAAGPYVQFTVPSLTYWDMVFLVKSPAISGKMGSKRASPQKGR